MTYATAKHDLEDHIELLHKLDEARTKSGLWMDEGIEVLLNHKDDLLSDNSKPMVVSLAIRALATKFNQPFEKEGEQKRLLDAIFELGKELQELKLEKILDDELSVLLAARVLQALVACPGAAFSSTALVCYYLIIRELYTAEGSDWNTGGVPAERGGSVTAFVTGECVRALLSFADAQQKTGDYILKVGEYKKRSDEIEQLKQEAICEGWINDWVDVEKERLKISCSLTLQRLSRKLVLSIGLLTTCNNELGNLYKEPGDLATELNRNLREQIKGAIEVKRYYSEAINQINACRGYEANDEVKLKSESAHNIALSAIKDAFEPVNGMNEYFNNASDDTELFKYCQESLNDAAEKVRNMLAPARNYLATVLDRELATVFMGEQWDWQPSELACAATAYGSSKYLPGEWAKDVRFGRAADQLSKSISRCGRIPNNRPYHVKLKDPSSSYYQQFYISNFTALTSLVQLLRNVTEAATEPDFIEKILSFFEDTRANSPSEKGHVMGWKRDEHFPISRKTELKSTAHAVFALAAINEMLDVRINHIVLNDFTVKTKNKGLKDYLTLDSVFYPDYGLKLAPVGEDLINRPGCIEEKDWPTNGIQRKKSVAVTLQQMYAHVSRVNLPSRYKPLCSLVLHGPAGTGKTTLVEALAVTCEVPLVEVTPSDLVKHGGENIEERARAVFYALSLLTRAVILFDEFDPVLKRRDVANKNPQNVFSFLTPGMLPKLKNLHDRAEKRSVVYVLITNLIGELDESAVRKGRFDERLGIYPPDLLSRAGRFLDQIPPDIRSKHFNTPPIPGISVKGAPTSKNGQGTLSFIKNTNLLTWSPPGGTILDRVSVEQDGTYMVLGKNEDSTEGSIFVSIETKSLPKEDTLARITIFNSKLRNRILEIIKKTEGKGMTTLGKPGWFTRPKEGKGQREDTPFGYVKGQAGPDEWPEPDDVFKNIIHGKGKTAVTECLQWQWIDVWDKELSENAATVDDLINALKKGDSLKNLQEPKIDET